MENCVLWWNSNSNFDSIHVLPLHSNINVVFTTWKDPIGLIDNRCRYPGEVRGGHCHGNNGMWLCKWCGGKGGRKGSSKGAGVMVQRSQEYWNKGAPSATLVANLINSVCLWAAGRERGRKWWWFVVRWSRAWSGFHLSVFHRGKELRSPIYINLNK